MALQGQFPWTKSPLIINAPMGGYAGGDLAIAVTLAHGLGFIGADIDAAAFGEQLAKVASSTTLRSPHNLLPIGAGVLLFASDQAAFLSVLTQHPPAVIWLFAEKTLDDYTHWTQLLRKNLPHTQIWIQISSVQTALTLAQSCRPDAFCVQGSDAGGHGRARGAGIISLVPEIQDALTAAGYNEITLVAAGGIADGRGAAAAFALGAQGVVLGTRFLAANETVIHPQNRRAVLAARDGALSTTRSQVFDQLPGPSIWPEGYDGRSLRIQSLSDFENGMSIEEVRRLYKEAKGTEDAGFGEGEAARAAVWAGTGVGLVNVQQGAAEIVESVREEASRIMRGLTQHV